MSEGIRVVDAANQILDSGKGPGQKGHPKTEERRGFRGLRIKKGYREDPPGYRQEIKEIKIKKPPSGPFITRNPKYYSKTDYEIAEKKFLRYALRKR